MKVLSAYSYHMFMEINISKAYHGTGSTVTKTQQKTSSCRYTHTYNKVYNTTSYILHSHKCNTRHCKVGIDLPITRVPDSCDVSSMILNGIT